MIQPAPARVDLLAHRCKEFATIAPATRRGRGVETLHASVRGRQAVETRRTPAPYVLEHSTRCAAHELGLSPRASSG